MSNQKPNDFLQTAELIVTIYYVFRVLFLGVAFIVLLIYRGAKWVYSLFVNLRRLHS